MDAKSGRANTYTHLQVTCKGSASGFRPILDVEGEDLSEKSPKRARVFQGRHPRLCF
jgi:hypothetical protein